MMGAASWAMYVASMNQAMPLVMLGLKMHVPSRRRWTQMKRARRKPVQACQKSRRLRLASGEEDVM